MANEIFLSFCVMPDLQLRDALPKDAHFQQAGYAPLLDEAD